MDVVTNSMIVTYGEHTVDFATVPHTSLMAMLRRGVSHYLGSEQASKVVALFDPDRKLAEGESRLEDTDENRESAKATFQAKALAAIAEGTVGVSTRGPGVDPLTAQIESIARKEVTAQLKDNKVKVPKKATDTVKVPGGAEYTMAQLVERRIARDGERLTGLAKAELAEKARKAKAIAENVKGESEF